MPSPVLINLPLFFVALCKVLEADATLRSAAGHVSAVCVPWGQLEEGTTYPVITYIGVSAGVEWADRVSVRLAAWGENQFITDTMIVAAINACNLNAFKAQGISACFIPGELPTVQWPGVDQEQGDPTAARTDTVLNLYFT